MKENMLELRIPDLIDLERTTLRTWFTTVTRKIRNDIWIVNGEPFLGIERNAKDLQIIGKTAEPCNSMMAFNQATVRELITN